MGQLSALDRTGDTRLAWDPDVELEVNAARTMFTKLKREGYFGYTVKANGEAGTVINEFDPDAVKIIMKKQMQGG